MDRATNGGHSPPHQAEDTNVTIMVGRLIHRYVQSATAPRKCFSRQLVDVHSTRGVHSGCSSQNGPCLVRSVISCPLTRGIISDRHTSRIPATRNTPRARPKMATAGPRGPIHTGKERHMAVDVITDIAPHAKLTVDGCFDHNCNSFDFTKNLSPKSKRAVLREMPGA